MSANPSARPQSRRALLTSALAGIAAGGVSYAVQSARASGPDPIFALIEAERAADAAFGRALDREAEAEEAFTATGLDRRPRVQVGTLTTIVSADGSSRR